MSPLLHRSLTQGLSELRRDLTQAASRHGCPGTPAAVARLQALTTWQLRRGDLPAPAERQREAA